MNINSKSVDSATSSSSTSNSTASTNSSIQPKRIKLIRPPSNTNENNSSKESVSSPTHASSEVPKLSETTTEKVEKRSEDSSATKEKEKKISSTSEAKPTPTSDDGFETKKIKVNKGNESIEVEMKVKKPPIPKATPVKLIRQ